MKSCVLALVASIASIVLFLGLSTIRADDASYTGELGPHKAQSIARQVLTDTVRMKELQLRIHYPDASGPFPLIVWSHGAGGKTIRFSIYKGLSTIDGGEVPRRD